MNPSLRSFSVAIPLAVLLGLAVPRPAAALPQPAGGAAPLAIGVVDLDRIAQAHPEFTRKRDELKGQHRGLREKLEALNKEAEALQANLETLNRESLEFAEADQQLRNKVASFDNMQKMYEAYIDVQLAKLQHETMNEIHALVDQFAKRKQLDLVLRHRALPADGARPGDVRDRMQVYAFRDLVWHAPTVDVTEEVIQFLKSLDNK